MQNNFNNPIRALSVDDIRKAIPDFTVTWLEENKNDARVLLWSLGINTDFNIEVQKGLSHRTRLCGIRSCDRIVGVERTDKEWLRSGHASDEAIMYTKDHTLTRELKKLERRT